MALQGGRAYEHFWDMSAAYWVDVFEDIVDKVRADSSKPSSMDTDEPFYMHGHPLEIVNILGQKDKHKVHKFNKYPLIALFQDFTETMGEDMTIKSSASLNLIIATSTSPDYNASQRYDNTFRTVLYPLYDLLMKHIVRERYFKNVAPNMIPHDKIDRLYWGKQGLQGNEGMIFMDHIDAIEIQNLSLDLLQRKGCN